MIARDDYAGPITKSAEAMFDRVERLARRTAAKGAPKDVRPAHKPAPPITHPHLCPPSRPALALTLALDALGLSISTLRNWENAGIVALERRGGRRVFDEAALAALRTITVLRHAGFSIKQIAWLSDTLPPGVETMLRGLRDRQDYLELERTRSIYRAKMATRPKIAASMGSRP